MEDVTAGAGNPKKMTRPITFSLESVTVHFVEWVANTFLLDSMVNRIEQHQLETVLALVKTLELRDPYTGGHSLKTADLAERTARRMGCSEQRIRHIRWAALLHDIGKVAIPDSILKNPAPLTEEEWAIMKRHPEKGYEIIMTVANLVPVASLVLAHQERFDGSGYPYGLRGEQIPLGARIITVVDAYSAITNGRVYKPARSHQEAMAELIRCSGSDFDPEVVRVFAVEIVKS